MITLAIQHDIIQRYKSHGSTTIARDLGINVRTVRRTLRRHGVALRTDGVCSHRSTKADLHNRAERICAMYRRDYPILQIAAECGVSKVTVWRIVKHSGMPMKQPRQRRFTCLDCGKPITIGLRCGLHSKIHNAEMNRIYKGGLPVNYDTVGRWRGKQSGYAGPNVMQFEHGEVD